MDCEGPYRFELVGCGAEYPDGAREMGDGARKSSSSSSLKYREMAARQLQSCHRVFGRGRRRRPRGRGVVAIVQLDLPPLRRVRAHPSGLP